MNSHLSWSSVLLRSFYRAGVRHAVLSPGSRSTPLTVAAAIHDGFQKQVILDERSAGFIALGIGKATGKPALLICTSGTAAANYTPAVMEARQSGVPMIVLTADRPPSMRGIGSSQTADQIKLYGDQAVFFHEAGEPRFDSGDIKRLRYLGRQAVRETIEEGGAAHINLAFRKPLEPTEEEIQEQQKINHETPGGAGPSATTVRKTIHLPEEIRNAVSSAKRPLIIAGPAQLHHRISELASRLSGQLNAPLIAEPGSGLKTGQDHTIARYEQFLRNPEILQELRPDLVIRTGDQPFTKSLLTAFDAWENCPVLHLSARTAPQDHAMHTTWFVEIAPDDSLDADVHSPVDHTGWLEQWKQHENRAGKKLVQKLDQTAELTDGQVFHHIFPQTGPEWNVMLSNSLIPRDMAMFGGSSPGQFVNRGVAGIDGIISTAAGLQLGNGKLTLCITGDLAFLHDSNALLALRNQQAPFVILVVNNGGGNIFRMLPIHQQQSLYTSYFETPQQVDLASLAKAHSLGYQKIDLPEDLKHLQIETIRETTIVECITDADASMILRKSLWDY
jgi:2-succinyl-5-enolpyruvyl-6-hydroxy-3-cyclohexene-1-carboxylate synthase